MLADPCIPVADEGQALGGFEAMVADNLEGRRVLNQPTCDIEPEPATLAQLGATARVNEIVSRLRETGHAMAHAAEEAAGTILAALISEAAARPELRVATWAPAHQAIGTLGDLLEQLAAAVPPADPNVGRGPH